MLLFSLDFGAQRTTITRTMGFDAEIKVRLSGEEKTELENIARQRMGGLSVSNIVREAIQEYLKRSSEKKVMINRLGEASAKHNDAKAKAAEKKQAARAKRAA